MIFVFFAESRPPVLQYGEVFVVNQQNLLKQLVQTFVPLRSIQVTHLGEFIKHFHLAIQTHHRKIIKGGGLKTIL